MTTASIAARLGGTRVLHDEIETDLDLIRALAHGLPAGAIDHVLGEGGLSLDELHRLVIPRRTLALRRQRRQALTAEESDRLARVARILAFADETFGDRDKSARWLRKANRGLAGNVPIELLSTETGGRLVEQALGRIAHGVFA
ncbi:MAG: toxin-antitoxin system antitoxin component family protein [Gemmatimonadetes bacterium]|nr:toxin-antitoxin system antitoxin component family protein [Gemmatimonadota bacterium]